MSKSCGCGSSSVTNETENKELPIDGASAEGCGFTPSKPALTASYIIGTMQTDAGQVPVVSTRLSKCDKFGAMKVRLGIGRMNYLVEPGLYAVGSPDDQSPVLVTANYKLTFDSLRKELLGINAWILVLDTKGVNVWCAAGKGTFGTRELVTRITTSELSKVVSHKKIIVPMLGAPGVSAHLVAKSCGFHVVYGPIAARDIPAFLLAGMKKTSKMSKMTFTTSERLAVIAMEIVQISKYLPVFFIAGAMAAYAETAQLSKPVFSEGLFFLGALLIGSALVPLLLPVFHPIRPFSAKGYIAGIIYATVVAAFMQIGPLKAVSWGLIAAAVAGFTALQFTGASTFTSESGVRKELRLAIPVLAGSFIAGIALRIGLIAHAYIAA
jgi:hypothetical protein